VSRPRSAVAWHPPGICMVRKCDDSRTQLSCFSSCYLLPAPHCRRSLLSRLATLELQSGPWSRRGSAEPDYPPINTQPFLRPLSQRLLHVGLWQRSSTSKNVRSNMAPTTQVVLRPRCPA
jgi:hypothetical protein